MVILYVLLAQYALGCVLVAPRAWHSTDWAPPDGLRLAKRLVVALAATMAWPVAAARCLNEEMR